MAQNLAKSQLNNSRLHALKTFSDGNLNPDENQAESEPRGLKPFNSQ